MAPLVYSRLFATGQRIGMVGLPFVCAIVFSLLAEVAASRVVRTELERLMPPGSKV